MRVNDSYLIVGHRGDSYSYPENTMLAIRKAIENGANAVEVDVRITIDGHYVLMHDHSLNRTTNGTGGVKDLTLEHLKTLDAGSWKGSEFSGREDTKIPTLQECLDFIKDNNVFLYLHANSGTFDEVKITELFRFVESSNLLDKVVFFVESNASVIKGLDSNAMATSWGGSTVASNYIERLNEAIIYGFNPFGVGVGVSKQMVDDIHNANLPVFISALSSSFESQTERLLNLGADMFLTDNVKASVDVFERRGIRQITPINDGEGSMRYEGIFMANYNGENKQMTPIIKLDGRIIKTDIIFNK